MATLKCMGCMEQFQGYPCPNCGYDPVRDSKNTFALPAETILSRKYLVGRVLGQGGFGITYVGWNLALDRKVAIKEYYPSGQVSRMPGTRSLVWSESEQAHAARSDGMQMFLKEAKKMVKTDGIPNVVQVLDLFQENGTAYIVMDFVEGETLKARLKRIAPMTWDEVKNIFLPAIRAMEQVHKQGIIHRDLSPDNLMLTKNGGVQILDLGAAKDLNINSGASSMQVAKAGFSPWEQYTQRGGSGTWTDVYAMAATIYYALTGNLPPNAIDRVERDTLDWTLPNLQTVPAPALETMKRAMAITANQRIQTMEELEKGLFSAAPVKVNKTTGQLTGTVKQQMRRHNTKRRIILAVTAALFCVGALYAAKHIKAEMAYQNALAKLEAGAYEDASAAFDVLGNYRDSEKKAAEAKGGKELADKYDAAQRLLDSADYAGAAQAFKALGDYRESKENAEIAQEQVDLINRYQAAEQLEKEGKYTEAANAYEGLGNYGDSVDRAKELYQRAYEVATDLLEEGDYKAAAEAFDSLGNYKDSQEKVENARNLQLQDEEKEVTYNDACKKLESGEYDGAYEAFTALGDYKESKDLADKAERGRKSKEAYNEAQALLESGKYIQAMWLFSKLDFNDSLDCTQIARSQYILSQRKTVAMGEDYTISLQNSGSVAIKYNDQKRSDYVPGWTKIVSVAAAGDSENGYFLGLREDGTVAVAGSNFLGKDGITGWTDIVAIAAGDGFSVGLKSDGTAVAVGDDEHGQCKVTEWKDILAVAAGCNFTVGLQSDGIVVATGDNTQNQCEVTSWKDIIAITAGRDFIVGLCSNGDVVAAGNKMVCNEVTNWHNIAEIEANYWSIIGLDTNGEMVRLDYPEQTDEDEVLEESTVAHAPITELDGGLGSTTGAGNDSSNGSSNGAGGNSSGGSGNTESSSSGGTAGGSNTGSSSSGGSGGGIGGNISASDSELTFDSDDGSSGGGSSDGGSSSDLPIVEPDDSDIGDIP